MRELGRADLPVWRCQAGSVDLIGGGRLEGYAADFARGCAGSVSLPGSMFPVRAHMASVNAVPSGFIFLPALLPVPPFRRALRCRMAANRSKRKLIVLKP